MTNIPEKCTRCGAPISWEEEESVVKCEYCGYKNNLKDDFRSLFKNYLKLRDTKKIIKNPISLIFLLPIIFLSILINSPTKKQESIKAEYWPTNWKQLKKIKYKDTSYRDKIQKATTIQFKADLKDACNYRDSLIQEKNNLQLNRDKALYEFNIRIGNKMQFSDYTKVDVDNLWDISMVDPKNIDRNPGLHKSPYRPNNYQYDIDKRKTIINFERINNRLKKENKIYWDFYYENYWNKWPEAVKDFDELIDLQGYKIHASFIEVLRQSGEKNWKLYTRWNRTYGIGDLYNFYGDKYKKSTRNKYITGRDFGDWLIRKKILDKSHFKKIEANETLNTPPFYNLNYILPGNISKIRKVNRICSAFK